METLTKKPKPGELKNGTTILEPGDKITCDPEYNWEAYDEGKAPKLEVPAVVINVLNSIAKVKIIDTPHTGKLIITNTDLYGEECYVLLSTITIVK